MKRVLVAVAACVALGGWTQSASAAFASGQDLLDGFNAMSRVGTANQKPTDPQRSARIAGYIQGTIDSGVSAGLLCPTGKGLTIRSAQTVLIEYLGKNPKMLNQAAVEAVMLSLHPKYRCE